MCVFGVMFIRMCLVYVCVCLCVYVYIDWLDCLGVAVVQEFFICFDDSFMFLLCFCMKKILCSCSK